MTVDCAEARVFCQHESLIEPAVLHSLDCGERQRSTKAATPMFRGDTQHVQPTDGTAFPLIILRCARCDGCSVAVDQEEVRRVVARVTPELVLKPLVVGARDQGSGHDFDVVGFAPRLHR